ncbi:hypothetical protein BGZ67_009997 [Mortierella alpina]|nr:hypothetical protein BGZ67_009997 [Mortierella alpina]
MDMSDTEDKCLDKNDEEEDEAHNDDNDDDANNNKNSNNNGDLGAPIKVKPSEDEQFLHSTTFASQEVKRSSSKGKGGILGPTILRADLLESIQRKEDLARSCLNARSKSISSISSSSSFSSPVLPRLPTRPPSAPLPAPAGQDAVLTAQDIVFGTASLGALTPIEIQRRMYEHSQFKAPSSRWPTCRRRRSAGVSLEGRSKVEPLSSSLQTQSTPFPLRKNQASAACPEPDRIVSGGAGAGGGSDNPINHNGSLVPALPSYYYLPPSAFRTAAAVAAEEQQEAEHRRKEEQEQNEREENSFFEFPSPSPSPPSQASPTS